MDNEERLLEIRHGLQDAYRILCEPSASRKRPLDPERLAVSVEWTCPGRALTWSVSVDVEPVFQAPVLVLRVRVHASASYLELDDAGHFAAAYANALSLAERARLRIRELGLE
jgi:hypothetical protein